MGIKYYKVYKNNREAKRTKYRTIEDAFEMLLELFNGRDQFKIVYFENNYEFGSKRYDVMNIDNETGEVFVVLPIPGFSDCDLARDAFLNGLCTSCGRIMDPDFKHYKDWDHYCHCVWCSEKY